MIDEAYLTSVLNRLVEKRVKEKIRPSGLTVGIVTSVSPLSIKLSSDLGDIPAEALIVGDQFQKFTLTTTDGYHTAVYDNRLKVGDKVRLLSNTGGQQFYIIGRA